MYLIRCIIFLLFGLLIGPALAQNARPIVPGDVGIIVPLTSGNLVAGGAGSTLVDSSSCISACVMPSQLTLAKGVQIGPTTSGLPTKATGEFFYDNTGSYIERNAPFNLVMDTGPTAPSGVVFQQYNLVTGKGNNATFVGVGSGFFVSSDRSDVIAATKGVLYGLDISIRPLIGRNNSPWDDATGLVVQNDSAVATAKATDAIYVGRGGSVTGSQWVSGVLVDADTDYAFRATGAYINGLDFVAGKIATFSGNPILLPNATYLAAAKTVAGTTQQIIGLNANNIIQIGGAGDYAQISGVNFQSFVQLSAQHNFGGAFPQTASGLAMGANFSNSLSEADLFNTAVGATTSFRFYQQTGAASATLLLELTTTSTSISETTIIGSASNNRLQLAGAANGSPVVLSSTGTSDADVSIQIAPKGAGFVQINNLATGAPAASLCIDASNNIIKKTTAGSCI